MKIYHYIVKGRVQGVAFRFYTQKAARDYNIEGTVKNLYNGDVEVYAQGEEENIRQFEVFLRSGPPAAHVLQLIKEESDTPLKYPGFQIIF
jgi:acylphosphatase